MGKIIPKVFDGSVAKSGFTITLSTSKSGQFFRIGITEAAQRGHFGGPLDAVKDAVLIELSDDQKDNHLMTLRLADMDEKEAFNLTGGIKGSVFLKLAPWTQVAPGKRPATELPVAVQQGNSEVRLKLPEWARPRVKKVGEGRPIME